MKKSFPEYFTPTKKEFSDLWENCIFAFDANILLSIYRYSPETRDSLFGFFEKLKGRLWIPNYAAYEFFERRLKVISEKANEYKAFIDIFEKIENDAVKKLKGTRHPTIDSKGLSEKIKTLFGEINKELTEKEKEHPDLSNKDILLEKIITLFDGKVGDRYPKEKLEEICKKGEKRFKENIPPGYKDNKKPGLGKYGDLIIWLQIIDKAKEIKKPIIFVTDDRKEDWWRIEQGKIIGPRPELIREIMDTANVKFYMYQTNQFLEFATDYLKVRINKKTIKEIKSVGDLAQRKIKLKNIGTASKAIAQSIRDREYLLDSAGTASASLTAAAAEAKMNNIHNLYGDTGFESFVEAQKTIEKMATEISRRKKAHDALFLDENEFDYLGSSSNNYLDEVLKREELIDRLLRTGKKGKESDETKEP